MKDFTLHIAFSMIEPEAQLAQVEVEVLGRNAPVRIEPVLGVTLESLYAVDGVATLGRPLSLRITTCSPRVLRLA